MLYFYTGTDRKVARESLHTHVVKVQKLGMSVIRITDANSVDDLRASVRGGGMFAVERIVVFEDVFMHDEMRAIILSELSVLHSSTDHFFILEEKPDALVRKSVEKYAHISSKHDAPKKGDAPSTIFALVTALKRGDKKNLWVGYQSELMNDTAPEAIHGVLFWGAKDMCLKARTSREAETARLLVECLAVLPHEARRMGESLEYALERFVLRNV